MWMVTYAEASRKSFISKAPCAPRPCICRKGLTVRAEVDDNTMFSAFDL